MKIYVDQLRCATAGICVRELPEVFQFQPGSKKAMAMKEDVPEDLHDRCRKVAEMCPENAIVIFD